MTRKELFAAFPRPWRQRAGNGAVILDAKGRRIASIYGEGARNFLDDEAMAELIVELVNGAEE